MTPPDSSARPPSAATGTGPAAGSPRPRRPAGRRLGAAIVAGAAGLVACAALFFLGALVYQRLFMSSLPALVVVVLVFGGAGLYAGWLAGTMAFSAVRGDA
jgi:hypothetical protein